MHYLVLFTALSWGADEIEAESTPPADDAAVSNDIDVPQSVAPTLTNPSKQPIRASNAPRVYRLSGVALSSGVNITGGATVVGSALRPVMTLQARVTSRQFTFAFALPFTTTDADSPIGLGNLGLSGGAFFRTGDVIHQVGVTVDIALPRPSYRWSYGTHELWPGYGLHGTWAMRWDGPTALLARIESGVRLPSAYGVMPAIHFSGLAAIGVEHRWGPFGLGAEVNGQWWSLSPLEAAATLRIEPIEGFELRCTAVAPYGRWLGLAPDQSGPPEELAWGWTTSLRVGL